MPLVGALFELFTGKEILFSEPWPNDGGGVNDTFTAGLVVALVFKDLVLL
jgi:hypothetical protein